MPGERQRGKASVIIPVHNRAKAGNCVKALGRQTYSDIEIVTVDCKGFPAEKRNYGFKKSTGRYVYFLDEDEYTSPTTIEDCVEKAEEGYDVVAVPVIKKAPISYMSRCVAITRMNTPKMMFFKREALDKIGLFDPKFVLCDDVEILERVIKGGFRIGQANTCYLLHDEETGLKGVLYKTLFARKSFAKIAYVCQMPTIVRITGATGTEINRKRIFKQLLKKPGYILGVLLVLATGFVARRIP